MARYISYDEEMRRLRNLLETVSSDEESFSEEDEEVEDAECNSNHNSSTENDSEIESENEVLDSSKEFYIGKDGTKWNKSKYRTNVRTAAKNIIMKLPGNTSYSKDVTTPLDSWLLIFDKDMIKIIVDSTNIYIDSIREQFARERDSKATNESEIKALIGLLYIGGVHKASHVNVKDLWATDGTGMDIFRKTMSKNRFLFLLRCLRFDNIHDRQSRRLLDKLAPIRELFEKFVQNCQKAYTIGEYVTIDEKLEPFRGRCSFKQYMPKKPAKYGIKIFALVDARVFYTYNLEIYAGKQPDGPFKMENGAREIVKRLIGPLYNSGRNLTIDNWYMGYQLSQELLKKKITVVGTMRKNKREIPPEFLMKKREVYSSLFGFQKETTILSYVPKKNKSVILLSTMHNDDKIDKSTGESKKPEIISFYNMTKGAVDVVDEMAAAYSTARISRRWPMVIFFSLLNVAAINARIILLSKKEPCVEYRSRRFFLKALGMKLIQNFQSEQSGQSLLPNSKDKLISKDSNNEPPIKKPKMSYKRCAECPTNKDRKTRFICRSCNKSICMEHMTTFCEHCSKL